MVLIIRPGEESNDLQDLAHVSSIRLVLQYCFIQILRDISKARKCVFSDDKTSLYMAFRTCQWIYGSSRDASERNKHATVA